jgi:hypothetical protein
MKPSERAMELAGRAERAIRGIHGEDVRIETIAMFIDVARLEVGADLVRGHGEIIERPFQRDAE